MTLDLPLIWAGIIALAVLMYVLLDGFDLGIGILFPFARSPEHRTTMMDTVAPIWDGNETWLVLGGGGLLAVFPVAYAVLMPALYLPIYLMLIALILRGVAFEFRLHGRRRGKAFWTCAFAGGSTVAAFAQGLVLGGFIQGVKVEGTSFAGGPFDWLTGYSLLVACGVVVGYALLGAGWLVLKTEGQLYEDARRWAWIALAATAVGLLIVSLTTLYVHPRVAERWGVFSTGLDWPTVLKRIPVPLLGLIGISVCGYSLKRRAHLGAYFGAVLIFLSGYFGLAAGFFPYVVPYAIDFRQAATAHNALALMLVGAAVVVPLILAYTGWVYWLFRGKVSADAGYH